MLSAALGLILIGASVAVHIDEKKGVSLEASVQVVQALARSIERETGYAVKIDDPDSPTCSADEACIGGVRARLMADEVLLVRLLGSPTLLRVVATLHGKASKSSAQVDMPKEESAWKRPIQEIVRSLFRDRSDRATSTKAGEVRLDESRAPAVPSAKIWPWFVFGGSAVVLATGIGFAWSGAKAHDRLASEFLVDQDYASAHQQSVVRTTIGEVLIGAAIAVAATGIALVLVDP